MPGRCVIYLAALGIATVLPLTAARAAGAGQPPATQPGKVVLKLLIGSPKPQLDAMPAEPWIAEQTAQSGCPVVCDCSDWVELSAQSRKIEAPRLGSMKFEGSARRDAASHLLMIDLAGCPGADPKTPAKKKSLMLLDRVGQRDVFKMDGLPDGRTVFVAMEVVAESAKPAAVWGEPVNNVRMTLRFEPETWAGTGSPAKGTIRFQGFFENVSEGQMQAPMWAGHQRVPLDITDAKGKAVDCQAANTAKNPGMWWGGNTALLPHAARSASISGEFADSTLTIVSNSGTAWRWKLPAGEYHARAVGDFQDFPYRGAGQPNGPVVYSQKVRFVVSTSTSQPDGK